MSIMAQTIVLAFRIALVWVGGFILAVGVRATLPDKAGVTFLKGGGDPFFVPYDRMGFWTCMLAALTVTALVVIRAMLVDFGVRPMH